MRRIPAFLLALLPLTAYGVVDTTSQNDPGAADTAWSWVGSVGGASGVAIGPRTVLTAKHVGASDFLLNGVAYAMESTLTAPKIKGVKIDLRVVQLRDVLPGWYALGTSAPKKSEVTMVGFGGAGVVNAKRSAYQLLGGGTRRAGGNRISERKTVKDRGPALLSLLDGAGESVLAGGDSGGGWFAGDKLVGVSSFVYTKNSKKTKYGWAKSAYFGSGAVDLTNSGVAKWVNGQILSGPRGMELQAVPEPGSMVALAVGAAGLLRRRRKNQSSCG